MSRAGAFTSSRRRPRPPPPPPLPPPPPPPPQVLYRLLDAGPALARFQPRVPLEGAGAALPPLVSRGIVSPLLGVRALARLSAGVCRTALEVIGTAGAADAASAHRAALYFYDKESGGVCRYCVVDGATMREEHAAATFEAGRSLVGGVIATGLARVVRAAFCAYACARMRAMNVVTRAAHMAYAYARMRERISPFDR